MQTALSQSRNGFSKIGAEDELLEDWFEDLRTSESDYVEPLLGETTNSFVKKTCDALKQGPHVFVMALDILERYLRVKMKTQCPLHDELFIVCICVLVASKTNGDSVELKSKHIEYYLQNISRGDKCGTRPTIRDVELDILKTLNGKILTTTKVDELDIVVEKFKRTYKLSAPLRPLCMEILQMLCVFWKDFFFDIKAFYSRSEEGLKVFKLLVVNRLYFPVGILLAALKVSNYKFVLDLNDIILEFSALTMIHKDHFETLSDKIMVVVYALQPKFPKDLRDVLF